MERLRRLVEFQICAYPLVIGEVLGQLSKIEPYGTPRLRPTAKTASNANVVNARTALYSDQRIVCSSRQEIQTSPF